jgi:bifunctional non-homologous end joining protein LigD
MGKRAASRYESGGRSRGWIKVKTVQEQEFVVGGYTPGEGGRRNSFGSLAIGYYENGDRANGNKLHYAGNVGSGFTDRELASVLKRLRELESTESPFTGSVEGKVTWVKPALTAQVKFTEWTKDGRLRAPVYLGLRDDIEPAQVGREVAVSIEAIAGPVGNADPEDGNRSPHPNPLPEGEGTRRDPAFPEGEGTRGATASDAQDVLEQLKNPKANFVAVVGGEEVKLSNLDKVFWPAYEDRPPLTKRDLVRFYTELAPVLLSHLRDRPLTLTRYPNGIEGSLFYQKHYAQPIPGFVETVDIFSAHNDEDGRYIMCNNLPTLVWLAQIADLELHAWMSRIDPEPDATGRPRTFDGSTGSLGESVLNFPDYMIFDLDPYIYSGKEAKGAEPEFNQRGWEKTVEVALLVKDLLDQLRLSSYVKTSGKTGLHVYVPVRRQYDYDAIRAFTRVLGQQLVAQRPRDVTMEWDTSKRTGKVFFDHNQNTRGKTLAAQYSLRPTPWAGVSTPIAWSELEKLQPATLNLTTLPARIAERGDLWSDILERKNNLGALLA